MMSFTSRRLQLIHFDIQLLTFRVFPPLNFFIYIPEKALSFVTQTFTTFLFAIFELFVLVLS